MSEKEWPADTVELGEAIVNLTLAQAVQLSDYLEQVHGIKPAASIVDQLPRLEEKKVEKEPEKTEFSVSLDGLVDPGKKIGLIKVVRELTSLGLKEAKEFVETIPKVVCEGVPKERAEDFKGRLEAAGGKVSIK